MRRTAALSGLITLVVSGLAAAQGVRPTAESFNVEWARRTGYTRPAVEGYVYNNSEYRVGNVLLRVETVDGSGQRRAATTAWVPGAIDAGGRGYFVLPTLEPGLTYQLSVQSFDLLSRQPKALDIQTP